jgi:hypothetical protein
MASKAQSGLGTLFQISIASVWTTIGEQQKITPYGVKVDQGDASHQTSPGGYKEFINLLKEAGDVSVDLQHLAGGADEVLILSLLGTTQTARTLYPSGANVTYSVNISDWQPENPHDGKVTGSLKLKITGGITLNAAAAPTNALLPSIAGSDGTPSSGDTLTAVEGQWNNAPTSYSYQWKKNGTNIGGATSKTWLVAGAVATDVITVAVTASNSAGSATATSVGAVIS